MFILAKAFITPVDVFPLVWFTPTMALFNSPTSAGSLLQPTVTERLPNFLVRWASAILTVEKEKTKANIKMTKINDKNCIFTCIIYTKLLNYLLFFTCSSIVVLGK